MHRLPDAMRIDIALTAAEASSAQKALGSQAAVLRLTDAAAARRVEQARRAIDKALRSAKRSTSPARPS